MARESPGQRKEILVVVAGMTPQVVTESLYALRDLKKIPVSEVWVFTTGPGREIIEKSLFYPESGKLHAYCREYGVPESAIQFDRGTVITVDGPDGKALADIRTARDYDRMVDVVARTLRKLAERGSTRIHCCIAGGRKGMGVVVAQALSLYARPQDMLYHLLVSPQFENEKDFFFPPRVPTVLTVYKPGGKTEYLDTKEARIEMASIPFVRLRDHLPDPVRAKIAYRADLAAVQESVAVQPEELVVDLARGTVSFGGRGKKLSPGLITYYAYFAFARVKGWGEDGDGFVSVGKAAEIEHQEEFSEMARLADLRRENAAIDKDRCRVARSKINGEIGKAETHAIQSEKRRGETRYGLRIAPERIRIILPSAQKKKL
ncbi:MAG: TIGR02584 family CRISPR-associated protein [Nitrospirae bacterium]|nr:TIGR02584 family CRISPR-associated protein [Nitrospirota bacterium]